jgi:uncharacterized protein YbcV (DUF1398 family)
MDPHVQETVERCTQASDAATMNFPQIVAELVQAGIERYHADLCRHEKTYYLPSGASHVVAGMHFGGEPAEPFSAESVEQAIRASQAQQIDYGTFCARVLEAGCVGYLVSLTGRRAVYYGRSGETHVEPFPSAR